MENPEQQRTSETRGQKADVFCSGLAREASRGGEAKMAGRSKVKKYEEFSVCGLYFSALVASCFASRRGASVRIFVGFGPRSPQRTTLHQGGSNFACGANYSHQALKGGYFVFVWRVGT